MERKHENIMRVDEKEEPYFLMGVALFIQKILKEHCRVIKQQLGAD